MTQSLIFFLGIVLAFVIGLFSSRKTSKEAAQVLDLTSKINENKTKAAAVQAAADAKVKEYQDALKAYDPNFGNDDDGGKPSA